MNARIEIWSPAEYHADPALSHSKLDCFLNDPAFYYGRHVARPPLWPDAESEALAFGTLFHEHFLFGKPLDELVCGIPAEVLTSNGQRRGNAYKDWCDARANEGRTPLLNGDLETLREMVRSIEAHPRAAWLFAQPGLVECPITWTDERDIERRSLLDLFLQGRCIVDLKTCASVRPQDFASAAVRFGHGRQASYYQEAVADLAGEVLPFLFVAVAKSPPYGCEVIELDAEFLAYSHEENQRGLDRWAECWRKYAETGDVAAWQRPGYGDILEVGMPGWAKYRGEWSYEPSN